MAGQNQPLCVGKRKHEDRGVKRRYWLQRARDREAAAVVASLYGWTKLGLRWAVVE